MKLSHLTIFLLFIVEIFSQTESFQFDRFSAALTENKLEIFEGEKLLDQRLFVNPIGYSVDLDGDSLAEFLIIDQSGDSTKENFIVYIFNTIDSFFLSDTLESGYFQPYFSLSDENNEMIIVAGNNNFLKLDSLTRIALPVNCYKFESGELLLINDELYDIFIQENEILLDALEQYFDANPKNCTSTQQIISAVSAIYANYINAGEPTLARQVISNYYYCEDGELFIKKMDELIRN